MSLFEDLVEELKEDNLLEETVIDSVKKPEVPEVVVSKEENVAESTVQDQTERVVEQEAKSAELPSPIPSELAVSENEKTDISDVDYSKSEELNDVSEQPQTVVSDIPSVPKSPVSAKSGHEKDFYRRRALDEVNGLEMVEHVLSGVEREQLKTVPKSYEDFEVKQVLKEFLQVADDVKSPDHAQAEFRLMQETEDWYSALSRRDRNISVGHLRRYCENSKPSLSSQALISLARFYRNSPYSEVVRSKFDLIVTKLFTKDIGGEKRELVFKADELVQHVQELYAEWSSVPLYATEEEDSGLLLTALRFQDFINEAENAESFDELVKKDFFRRLKVTKEKTNENFFAPLVVATAVESNVVVGNRYIELIDQEKANPETGNLSDKYGVMHDKSISEATSKTLELIEILKDRKPADSLEFDYSESKTETNTKYKSDSPVGTEKGVFGANKWLVLAAVATVILALLYFFALSGSVSENNGDVQISKNVKIVNLENSVLGEHVQMAKIKGDTLFAITNISWNTLGYKAREEVVEKFVQVGSEKGYKKVHFMDSQGVTVAFGDEDGANIVN